MSTDEQIEMLQAIEGYRLGLPEKRFAVKKNHLPEITSSNVSVMQRFWKDVNGKKASRVKYSYRPTGLVDGTVRSAISGDKFSVENKVRFIQRSASAQKIDSLRTQYEKLIGTPKKQLDSTAALNMTPLQIAIKKQQAPATEEPILRKTTHPFTKENCDSQISLSVYNRPKHLAEQLPSPIKKAEEYLKQVPGYKPPVAKPDALAEPVIEPAKREPKVKQPVFAKDFAQITKDTTDAYRLQQMEEVISIRNYIAKAQSRLPNKAVSGREAREPEKEAIVDIPSLKVFERAIILPTEHQCEPQLKKYPKDGDNLDHNENKKSKGKGKKGGKKKKR